MDIKTTKDVTHQITMSQHELRILLDMVKVYKHEIGDKLPSGMPGEAHHIFLELNDAYNMEM